MAKGMEKKDLSFGKGSTEKLKTLHPKLRLVVQKALDFGVMDFSVIDGIRTYEEQRELFLAKPPKTKLDGVTRKSKHQADENGFSQAVDLLPYPAEINGVNVWSDSSRFHILAGLMYAAASELGVVIRWGGDWDSDGNNKDSSFDDLPHFELAD